MISLAMSSTPAINNRSATLAEQQDTKCKREDGFQAYHPQIGDDAIVRALESGQLAGYAGDVWFPLSAQARYAAGTREILESYFAGKPIRIEYWSSTKASWLASALTPIRRATPPRARRRPRSSKNSR